MRLTEKQLQEWVRQGQPLAGRSDGDGLTFTLSSMGAASWVLRYRLGGRQREVTIGSYPDVGLSLARRLARAERVNVDQGKDVATVKRAARLEMTSAPSFAELAASYVAFAERRLRPKTVKELRRYLKKDLNPRLGSITAREVTSGLIVAVIQKIGNRSESVARHAFEHLAMIFAYAIAKGAVTASPCASLRASAILGKPRRRRERKALQPEDLRVLLAALPRLERANELAIKILLATCVRKSELILAERTHVDLVARAWHVPAENAKTGRAYTIPLAPHTAAWFGELLELAGPSKYVLPARTEFGRLHGRPISENTLNAAIDRLAGDVPELARFSPHDLRSTARSRLAALGVDLIVAERCLNHSLGGLLAIYDKHDYMAERRLALEKWEQFLMSLEPQDASVIALRAAA